MGLSDPLVRGHLVALRSPPDQPLPLLQLVLLHQLHLSLPPDLLDLWDPPGQLHPLHLSPRLVLQDLPRPWLQLGQPDLWALSDPPGLLHPLNLLRP